MNTNDNSPSSNAVLSSNIHPETALELVPQTEPESIPDTLRCPEIPPPPASGLRFREDVPDPIRSEIDELILAASRGSRRAIAAVGIVFGHHLVALAQAEVERANVLEEEAAAADIVAELLEGMAQGVFADDPPEQGHVLEWLEGVVRRAARVSDRGLYGEAFEDEGEEAEWRDDGSGDRWRPVD